MQFGISPVPTNDGSTSEGYFILKGQAGETIDQAVLVSNPGTTPVKLQLFPVDASTGDTGGAVYANAQDPRKGVGDWITLGTKTIDLQPQTQATVNLKVAIPHNISDGQYLGGIGVQQVDGSSPVSSQSQQGTTVKTVSRALTAVLINIGDKKTPSLRINSVQFISKDGASALTLGLQNDGNSLIKPSGELTLTDNSGKVSMTSKMELDTFVPGTSISYPVAGDPPKTGTYKVHVSLNFGGSAPAVYDGTVDITTPEANSVPSNATGQQSNASQPVTSAGVTSTNTNQPAGSASQPGNTSNKNVANTANTANIASVAPNSSDTNNSMLMGFLVGICTFFALTTFALGGYLLFRRAKKDLK